MYITSLLHQGEPHKYETYPHVNVIYLHHIKYHPTLTLGVEKLVLYDHILSPTCEA